MKLVCIDFDGTLTRQELIYKIKNIIAMNWGREDIKIGILTARSVYDDFQTPGQFDDDIETLLIENDIRLDFISTTYAHYKLDRHMSPEYAIADAEIFPVFGHEVSDYLLYRRENIENIVAIRNACKEDFFAYLNNQGYKNLQITYKEMIDKESDTFTKYVRPKMLQGSAKPAQIEAVALNYGNVTEVLLIDDSLRHVSAVKFKSCVSDNCVWRAELISSKQADLDRVFDAIDTITENPYGLSSPDTQEEDSELISISQDSDDEVDLLDSLQEVSIPEMPTKDNQTAKLIEEGVINKKQVDWWKNETHPIADPKLIALAKGFLAFKNKMGTSAEKNVYTNMNIEMFITRLLTKRPLMFMGSADQYMLRDGTMGSGGFELIGSDDECDPLKLSDYLSYDEMQIASILGVSSPTHFINNGNRFNRGKATNSADHEVYGIYVGQVGARFEKPGLMEWQHMMVTPTQNIPQNGYGKNINQTNQMLVLWAEFYGIEKENFPSWSEAQNNPDRFLKISSKQFLDLHIYKKRMKSVIEAYLKEANMQGKKDNRSAYVHAVGLGSGVWAVDSYQQERIIVEAYKEVLTEHTFEFISDVNFSWFNEGLAGANVENKFKGNIKRNHGDGPWSAKSENINNIQLHFSNRNPADKLVSVDQNKLLVAQYAWDGNSYPGNEYWCGMLTASGDPAAACCSLIAELQSPKNINNISGSKLLNDLSKKRHFENQGDQKNIVHGREVEVEESSNTVSRWALVGAAIGAFILGAVVITGLVVGWPILAPVATLLGAASATLTSAFGGGATAGFFGILVTSLGLGSVLAAGGGLLGGIMGAVANGFSRLFSDSPAQQYKPLDESDRFVINSKTSLLHSSERASDGLAHRAKRVDDTKRSSPSSNGLFKVGAKKQARKDASTPEKDSDTPKLR